MWGVNDFMTHQVRAHSRCSVDTAWLKGRRSLPRRSHFELQVEFRCLELALRCLESVARKGRAPLQTVASLMPLSVGQKVGSKA